MIPLDPFFVALGREPPTSTLRLCDSVGDPPLVPRAKAFAKPSASATKRVADDSGQICRSGCFLELSNSGSSAEHIKEPGLKTQLGALQIPGTC